jgi:hypothetical protein
MKQGCLSSVYMMEWRKVGIEAKDVWPTSRWFSHDSEPEICKYRTYESSFHVKAVSCIYIFVVVFCNSIVYIP